MEFERRAGGQAPKTFGGIVYIYSSFWDRTVFVSSLKWVQEGTFFYEPFVVFG
jgi:hypothetical protein